MTILESTSTTHEADIRQLQEVVVRSAFELFAASGVTVTRISGPRLRHPKHLQDLVGMIGFAGPSAKGSIGIRTPRVVAVQTHPLRASGPIDEAASEDWMGELTNRLLGRVKNHCLSLGLELYIGVPRVVTGTAMDLPLAREGDSFTLHFDCDGMDIDIGLAVVTTANGSLFSCPIEEPPARESTLLFFE